MGGAHRLSTEQAKVIGDRLRISTPVQRIEQLAHVCIALHSIAHACTDLLVSSSELLIVLMAHRGCAS